MYKELEKTYKIEEYLKKIKANLIDIKTKISRLRNLRKEAYEANIAIDNMLTETNKLIEEQNNKIFALKWKINKIL